MLKVLWVEFGKGGNIFGANWGRKVIGGELGFRHLIKLGQFVGNTKEWLGVVVIIFFSFFLENQACRGLRDTYTTPNYRAKKRGPQFSWSLNCQLIFDPFPAHFPCYPLGILSRYLLVAYSGIPKLAFGSLLGMLLMRVYSFSYGEFQDLLWKCP